MTSDQIAAEARIARDLQMLADITALKDNEAFNRYWLGRLRSKRTAIELTFRTADPKDVDKDRREELRQQVLLLDELLGMMAKDEGGLKAGLRT